MFGKRRGMGGRRGGGMGGGMGGRFGGGMGRRGGRMGIGLLLPLCAAAVCGGVILSRIF